MPNDVQYATQPHAVVQSDTTILNPPVREIIISAEGSLAVESEKGDSVTLVVPAGASLPFVFRCGRVRRILDTGTDIANANLVAMR